MLPLIKEQVETRSKLLKYVNLQPVGGTSRTPVMGTIPEAVWTEMCGKINELALGFTAAEVDGYKVAGYLPICNALLEDNDVDLVANVVYALGRSIALALDKAIIYGTGTKMPQGIVTRLVQTAAPETYPTTMRPWADLHTSNVVSVTAANSTGTKLFQALITAFGAAKKAYGAEGKFWAMNEKTHMKLLAEAVNFNAEGALVAGLNNTMPVVGGDIVELDFMPDNVIVAGYGEQYLLAERAGMQVTSSEHVKFLDDQTVFMGKARYDGLPVIAEGFVAIGINAATVAANAVTFAADTANA
jgi:HK97 family phage major capsid protein